MTSVKLARKFTLRDAMVLVAACAVGTLAVRTTLPDLQALRFDLRRVEQGMRIFLIIQYGLSVFIPYLGAMTVAIAVIRLFPPRPRLRRAAAQPGMIACSVATMAMLIEAAWIASLIAAGSHFIHLESVFAAYAQQVSFAVLGAWIAVGLSGHWRAEASWVDRTGRGLGAAWIAVTIISWSRYYLT